MSRRRIGILGYDGIQALDLVGPAEAFAAVPAADGTAGAAYEIVIVALGRRRFVSETGLTLCADVTVGTRTRLDTLIVPGGRTMRGEAVGARAAAFVAGRVGRVRRIASVCTGIFGVAPAGVLDGRRVTTHWRYAPELQRRFPRLRVEANALFIKDGAFYTSAGVTAGIDLALALIEEDHGPSGALAAARELVVYVKRPGGQDQFSEPLRYQLQSADRFADLVAWLAGHLDADLSVEAMAARVFLSPRQFTRVFTAAYGTSPAAFVEQLRLGEAGRRLTAHRGGVETVAASIGYRGADVFRRAFERRFGVSPREYRSRFTRTSPARGG
ncbi:MAG TPA: DJ-1/PfpI family protein [Gemmatimonadales bacterium]|nr:DJ-1/PfpI family protein [Gemmatimonadales bacterium]